MKFKKIYIEITNRCNFNCSFCIGTKRKPAFMSPGDFETIISRIDSHTQYIYMHVLGEPLLHPQIDELMDICHDHHIRVNLTTNGSLIKQAATRITKPALRQVNISMHSMAGEADNAQYIDDILTFALQCHEHLFVNLRFWNKGSGDAYTQEFLQKIKAFFHYNGDLTDESFVGNGVKVHPQVYVQQNTQFTWPSADGDTIFTKGKCYGLRDHIAILVDGTVVPCCLDAEGAMALGNIFEQPLDDILNTKRVHAMKNGFGYLKVIEPFCRTCGFAKRLNM